MQHTKAERLAESYRRLQAAPAASTIDEAFRLLGETLDAVEDEMTTTPNVPANFRDDGRMYPRQMDR